MSRHIVKDTESRLHFIVGILDRITWFFLFVLMMMTIINVILRLPLFNASIIGYKELTELMMVIIVFCALAQCQADDGHIKVDLLMKRFSPKTQAFVDSITQLVCFGLFCMMTWALYLQSIDLKHYSEITMDLRLPLYPFAYVTCIGSGALALVLLFKALAAFYEVFES